MSVESALIIKSNVWTCSQTYCRPVSRMRWLKNKGALLIASWIFLVIPAYSLLRDGLTEERKQEDPLHVSVFAVVVTSATLFFPIGGWLADAHLGRYKTVHYSMWIMWIGAILATFGEVMAEFSVVYNDHIKVWLFSVLCVIVFAGLAGFSSNIIQLGIDQLFDASASEIHSFILWSVLGIFASVFSSHLVSECITSEYDMFYIKTLTVAVCLSLALCSDFACKDWLVKVEVSKQSLVEVWKIIWYTIKNRKVRYDFIAHNENELKTLFDIAKHQYGGPFTVHQVNNARTFLWMIVVLATCGVVFGAITPVEYARQRIQHRWEGYHEVKGLVGCYMKLIVHYEDCIIILVLVSLYEFFIRPIFYKCLPEVSIINRFVIGMAFFFLLLMSLLAIESYTYCNTVSASLNNSLECIFNHEPEIKLNKFWFLIPDFVSGASHILLYVTAFEFIWAQTPSAMKGLMLGVAFTILGLNTLFHGAISFPFLYLKHTTLDWHPLTCGIWYFIMEGILTLVALTGTTIVVIKYKKKDKNNIIMFDRQTGEFL